MKKWLSTFCLVLALAATISMVVHAQSATTIAINNIVVTPDPGNAVYKVVAYLSVLENTGLPIKNLTPGNFSVIEDAQPMAILSVESANDPMSLVLVLDTSGSMGGTGIEMAKEAANSFLLGMGSEDEVSILSFNNTVNTVIGFTKDRQEAGQQLSSIDSIPNSATCLYDAAYKAVQSAAALPAGRRAVVLFTDGVDEVSSGVACSTNTIDDVINLASQGNAIIPIYTLGMGVRIDQQALQRLADVTEGHFQSAPDANQLKTIFQNLSDVLKNQYALTYLTSSAQGSHTLVLRVSTPVGNAESTRNFISPVMPVDILFTSPEEGQSITGKQLISIMITGNTAGIGKVLFTVGGEVIGETTTSPYELNFEFTSTFAGNTTIGATILGENGQELINKAINVNVIGPTPVPAATTNPQSSGVASSQPLVSSPMITTHSQFLDAPYTYILGAGGFLIVVAGVGLLIRKRQNKPVLQDTAFGKLVVLYSDSPGVLQKEFSIGQPVTKLGRLIADNDIAFPDDKPVSKHHAIIEKKGDNIYLYEVTPGTTYGTYVNDTKIGTTPVLLHDGNEIKLGTRLKLKFSLPISDRTVDNLQSPSDDATIDYELPPKEPKDPFATQDPG